MSYQHSRDTIETRIFLCERSLNDAVVQPDLPEPADRNSRRAGNDVCGAREFLSAVRRRTVVRAPSAVAAYPSLFHRVQRGRLLRLQSDHHEMAIHLTAGRAEYFTRGDGADRGPAGARLHLRRAERSWHILPPQSHHRALLVSRVV